MILARGQRGGQPLSPALADGGTAHQREGDVAADVRRDLPQSLVAEPGVPQLVAGEESGGGIGAPAGQPGGHRYPFPDSDLDRPGDVAGQASGQRESRGGLQGQILRAGGHRVRALAAHQNPVSAGAGLGHGHVVVQRNRLEHGHEVVVTVGAARPDGELEVDLGGGPHGHTGHDPPILVG